MSMELQKMTVGRIARGLEEKTFSAREIADAYLSAAEDDSKGISAYVAVLQDAARKQADESDARRARGEAVSPWDGVPVAVKDNILVAGARATAGSMILKEYMAPYDATVTTRLKDAGMTILGKTNMDEFAMGSSTETSCHGPTRNPWDTERIPGGSSGGSAAAVAGAVAPIALGSDTGGSIRQPAAMCGVVGFKPTYGRVSRHGLMAMASSLDQIGPLAMDVEDASMLTSLIEGLDPMDSTSVALKDEWTLADGDRKDLKGLRIGLPTEYFVSGMEPGVERAVRAGIERLTSLGAEVKEVALPNTQYALAVYYIIMPSEASANLSRFDGIRYGARVAADTLEETYLRSRGTGLGAEVRRRIMVGTYALSAGYYDAYYLKALKVRRLISNDFARAFSEVDCIVAPTVPGTAWKIGEKIDDPLSMYLSDIYTVSVNIAGLPAISVPCGLSGGLPVGLQMIGKHFDDRTVLAVAKAFEAAGDREGYASQIND